MWLIYDGCISIHWGCRTNRNAHFHIISHFCFLIHRVSPNEANWIALKISPQLPDQSKGQKIIEKSSQLINEPDLQARPRRYTFSSVESIGSKCTFHFAASCLVVCWSLLDSARLCQEKEGREGGRKKQQQRGMKE